MPSFAQYILRAEAKKDLEGIALLYTESQWGEKRVTSTLASEASALRGWQKICIWVNRKMFWLEHNDASQVLLTSKN